MIGASKILTVSYGTFSCTLEGFDDPFNTMKAIAEYFRDLAAEDRYFGAEPPTPDAAMLHKIAEREIQRRVEAKINEHGVILRAGDAASPDAPREIAPPPAPSAPPVAEAVVAEAPEPQPALSDSVAAKLMRIRSAVAQSQGSPAPALAAPIAGSLYAAPETAAESAADIPDAEYVEDAAEPERAEADFDLVGMDLAEVELADMDLAEIDAPELELPDVEPTQAERETDDAAADDAGFDSYAEEPAPLAETLADEPAPFAEAPAFDLIADAEPEAVAAPEDFDLDADLTAFLADLPEAEADTERAEAPAPLDDDMIASLLAAEDPLPEDNAEADDMLAEDDFSALAPVEAEAVSTTGWIETETAPTTDLLDDDGFDEDLLAALDGPLTEAAPEPVAELLAAPAEPDLSAAILATLATDTPVAEEKPAMSDKAQRARARVIKIRRSEPAPVAAKAPLSPEAEADLLRELSEVERDLAPAAPAPAEPVRTEPEARKQLPQGTGDDAVNRLIEQTNSEMHEPANRRRLSALAHLKAAVAATVADRRAGAAPAPSDADRSDPYRNDLARVVRPRRPGEAADADRPAPLVLVSEQRIDRPKPTAVAPAPTAAPVAAPALVAAAAPAPAYVRPRRVSSAQLAAEPAVLEDEDDDEDDADIGENLFTETRGFADFAERLGAHALPDLLEAAAAYTACVEGRPHFSRPQLIRHVNAVAPENAQNREAGLRSFGALLRTGKIAKVKRGQFALTESSHFLTEARKIAH